MSRRQPKLTARVRSLMEERKLSAKAAAEFVEAQESAAWYENAAKVRHAEGNARGAVRAERKAVEFRKRASDLFFGVQK